MANKRHWDLDQEKKRIEYPFHCYVRSTDGPLLSRLGDLDNLAKQCGDHGHWSMRVLVDGDMQDWIVWGFKSHDHKLTFDAGAVPIMARKVTLTSSGSLPNRLADPNADFTALGRRMMKKGVDDRH